MKFPLSFSFLMLSACAGQGIRVQGESDEELYRAAAVRCLKVWLQDIPPNEPIRLAPSKFLSENPSDAVSRVVKFATVAELIGEFSGTRMTPLLVSVCCEADKNDPGQYFFISITDAPVVRGIVAGAVQDWGYAGGACY